MNARYVAAALVVGWWVIHIPFACGQEDLPSLVKRIEPSIVVVVTYGEQEKPVGQGTGFFVNKDGDVVTNHHVLEGASRAQIRSNDGNLYPVKKVLAEDRDGDLVRVAIDHQGDKISPLPLGTSFPEVGERIFVIGTPLGLEKTVSDGIVSAVREIPGFGKVIQLTAPISRGSSGSPVVNMKGEVVGVATFFVVAGQNLNFAIPAERISRLSAGEGKTLPEWEEGRKEEMLSLATQAYAFGLRYLWAGNCQEALLYFSEVVKRNPGHGDAHYQIGYCLAKLGRPREAIEAFTEASRLKPQDPDPPYDLCILYNQLERYDNALESCTKALRIKPGFAEALVNLAWTLHRVGRYQESIESCREAIRLKPDFALAYYSLGNNYASLKVYPGAMEAYKQVIRLEPDHAEAHLNLGGAYFELGRQEDAIESYKQAIRLKPDFAKAHLALGMAYLRGGDRSSALEEYKILKGLDRESANRLFNLMYE